MTRKKVTKGLSPVKRAKGKHLLTREVIFNEKEIAIFFPVLLTSSVSLSPLGLLSHNTY